MGLPYDTFISSFLMKITSYDYVNMEEEDFNAQAHTFLFGACSEFEYVFRPRTNYSFTDRDNDARCFNWDLPVVINTPEYYDIISEDEVVDIVSEGMVLRWLKSFLYAGDGLELGNFLSTKDFSPYSPSNFLNSLRTLYDGTMENYRHLINDFSYKHGDLRTLHM